MMQRHARVLCIGLALACIAFSATACKRKVIEVIGGYAWMANFMDQKGYVVTDGAYDRRNRDIMAQYNFANDLLNVDAAWVEYQSDNADKKPFTCGACHTTGYTAEGEEPAQGYAGSDACKGCHGNITGFNESGHQHAISTVAGSAPDLPKLDGPPETFSFGNTAQYDFATLPGIQGQWKEPNVGCEACHGPSKAHASNKDDLAKRPDLAVARESCSTCHASGSDAQIETDGNFVLLGQEWEEWQASAHANDNASDNRTFPTCATCHNAHASTVFDDETAGAGRKIYTNAQCQGCHADTSIDIPQMASAGVMCIDCHMPWAGKAANGYPKIGAEGNYAYVGDVRSHQFKIKTTGQKNTYIDLKTKNLKLDADGKTLGLTLDLVCQPCHTAGGIRPHNLPQASPMTFTEAQAQAVNVHTK